MRRIQCYIQGTLPGYILLENRMKSANSHFISMVFLSIIRYYLVGLMSGSTDLITLPSFAIMAGRLFQFVLIQNESFSEKYFVALFLCWSLKALILNFVEPSLKMLNGSILK